MKELSIEEKARRYDEAYKKVAIRFGSNVADEIFLKESEDERIRKELISHFVGLRDNVCKEWYGIKINNIIAWLEKQGNLMKCLQISNSKIGDLIEENYYLRENIEKQGKNNMGISETTKQELEDNLNKALEKETPESCNEFLEKQGEQLKKHDVCDNCDQQGSCVSPCPMKLVEKQGEQKPADKVEPKFKVGDFIVNDYCMGRIVEITNDAYLLDTEQGIPFSGHSTRLWDIAKDAKDGDVLVSESNCGLNTWYCIFKSLDDDESMTVHCYLARDGRLQTMEDLCFNKDPRAVKPATKEQRDTLMKAIADAGYTFDFEKKELKKIEQNPAWGEEDERMCKAIIDNIQAICEEGYFVGNIDSDELIRWLKFLRPQNTWKPSDEQMNTLEYYMHNLVCTKHKEILFGLYADLKKLKE